MSRFIDSLIHGPKQSSEEYLTGLITSRIGPRQGLPSLNDAAQHQALVVAMKEALKQASKAELGNMIRWVFDQPNDFWRDRLAGARRIDRYFITSLPTMLTQFRDDWTIDHDRPKRLPQSEFMRQLKSITPQDLMRMQGITPEEPK